MTAPANVLCLSCTIFLLHPADTTLYNQHFLFCSKKQHMINNYTTILLLSFASILMHNSLLAGNAPSKKLNDPPFLVGTIQDTIFVDCIDDIPPVSKLNFDDDTDPAYPQEILPVDGMHPTDGCIGGFFNRTWTATDIDMATTIITQVIVVRPDTQAPVTTAALRRDTFSCSSVDYSTWLNSVNLAFNTNTTDNCSDLSSITITEDAPPNFTNDCGTLTVTFTAEDACNNILTWEAKLTTIDTIKPVLVGIPAADTIRCDEAVPAAPTVTATDNCDDMVDVILVETDNKNTNPEQCNHYRYQITRTWTATDNCGNTTTATQIIQVQDTVAPNFTRPADIQILCTDDAQDLSLTGNISDITDNCATGFTSFSFTDVITPGSCSGNYTIQRNWRVSDVCNNALTRSQTITVVDNVAPLFTAPANINISCEDSDTPANTGSPTNISDNCVPNPIITFIDVIIPGTCSNTYTIQRTWTATDSCGNERDHVQFINVSDMTNPVISTPAQNRTVYCSSASEYQTAFAEWVAANGNAIATDNCTDQGDLSWAAFNQGTMVPASLPAPICPVGDTLIISHNVTFVVTDECGNSASVNATFRVIDNQAPVFTECPDDQTISTDPGQCSAQFALLPPIVVEECGNGSTNVTSADTKFFSSSALPGQEGNTPVDPILLEIPVNFPLPINATGPATLTIALENADAEAATEFFNIIDEDGQLLGTTAPTPTQCGDSTRTFTLSAAQINSWAVDGSFQFLLEPNIPTGVSGSFAVNNICPGGRVIGSIDYSARNINGIYYEYSVNDGPRTPAGPAGPFVITLDQGSHQINYFASDCAGNLDSCSYMVTVLDLEAPVLPCPADIVVSTEPGSCKATVTLPFPSSASDNCGIGSAYTQSQPQGNDEALLTFNYDPNLTDYIAQPKTYTFTGVSADASADASITLRLRGDFASNGAFVRLFGENNTFIGATPLFFSDCTTNSEITFTIPRIDFNTWAADGQLSIQIVPNIITVPPGVATDGINPCDPAAVNEDGDNDGLSFIFATLEYNALEVQYFAEGATTIPTTTMAAPDLAPSHVFNAGSTEVFYTVTDHAGNEETCSFIVNVKDTELPVALCQPTTLFISPAGTASQTIDPMLLDAGSTDNCGIVSTTLSMSTFSCLQAGINFPVTLTVTDEAGNAASCPTFVRVEIEKPVPTASTGICGGDTLFLFANPPAAVGGVIYTYQWSGPLGFTSNLENPIIPNIDPARAGSYSVTITGLTGCTASGSVEVTIENLPLLPVLNTPTSICTNQNIVLNSGVTVANPDAIYNWYEGLPPTGTLLASTSTPQYTLPGPHAPAQRTFYLTLAAGPCLTAPSLPVTVTVSAIPTAIVNNEEITICQGDALQLGTASTGTGMTYAWSGPNFSSAMMSPQVAAAAGLNANGIYTLVVTQNGCSSAPDTTIVTVKPKPATPILSSSGPACTGGSVLLTASTVGSLYHWLSPNGAQPVVTMENTLLLQNVTAADAGAWRVYVTQFGCDSDLSAPVQVVVNAIPQAIAEAGSSTVCEGLSLQLTASPLLVNAQYIWSGPAGFSSSQRTPLINQMTPNRAGFYRVTITTAEGCSATDSVNVAVTARPVIVGLSNNAPTCIASPTNVQFQVTLNPPDNGTYTYEWSGPCAVLNFGPNASIPNATIACNGVYQLIVRNADGCASAPATTFVNLTNAPTTPSLPVISSGNAGTVCEGQTLTLSTTAYTGNAVNYFWQTPAGIIPTTTASLTIPSVSVADSGPYTVSVNVDGCVSAASPQTIVTVGAIPQVIATSNSPLCEGETIQFSATAIPGAQYQWLSLSNPFTSSVPNPQINNADSASHAGLYTLLVINNGCRAPVQTINVTVYRKPMRPTATAAAPVCISAPGATATFNVNPATASPGATFEWFDQQNNLIGTSNTLSFSFSNVSGYTEGIYPFFVRAIRNGCLSPLSESFLVTFNTIPTEAANAGADTEKCPNEDILLDAMPPARGTGFWSFSAGNLGIETIVNPAQANSQVNGLLMGQTYTLRWTLSNGACLNYAFDEVDIHVREIDIARAGADTTICPGTPFSLYATPVSDAVGTWSQPDVQQLFNVAIADTTSATSAVNGMTAGNAYLFVWTITGQCNVQRDTVVVTVSDVPPFAGPDFRACNNDELAELDARTPAQGNTGFWSSPDIDISFIDAADPKTTAEGLKPGFNTLIWTINAPQCGGIAVDTLIVEYTPNPEALDDEFDAVFGEINILDILDNDFVPDSTTIRIISAPGSGSASVNDDGTITYMPDNNFFGQDQFMYELCSQGCECAVATVLINVNTDSKCAVPSVITPNGDNVNDAFIVPCLFDTNQYPNSQVLIFNRWGDEVFRSAVPYLNNWQGTFNGQELPHGTYFYVVDYGNGSVPANGFFMIVR
jgi:gliding motility-associated-like protein